MTDEAKAAENKTKKEIEAEYLRLYKWDKEISDQEILEDTDATEGMTPEEAQQYYFDKAASKNRKKDELNEKYRGAYGTTKALYNFANIVSSAANTPAIKTGFTGLDEALGGGLYEGLYVLGAVSSLGKTTFTLQIADQIAQSGQDVIIISLEMARTELMAKSISRHTAQYCDGYAIDKSNAKTVRGITDGDRWAKYSTLEKEVISESIAAYAEYTDNIFIFEGVGDIGVNKISEIIDIHQTITGNTPIVIIDYLQLLAPYDPRYTDKQNTDKNVLELKRITREYKTPVIAISSFNRESYKANSISKGAVSIADFKESGAIEYSSDVLIGLQFQSAGEKDYNEKDEKQKNPREIKLVIMKNRNYKAWEEVNYLYYPLFNLYEEENNMIKKYKDFKLK